MKTKTVNISINPGLLKRIDKMAKVESRSRSELIREATRMYLERTKKWDFILAKARAKAGKSGLTGEVISKEIANYRCEKNRT